MHVVPNYFAYSFIIYELGLVSVLFLNHFFVVILVIAYKSGPLHIKYPAICLDHSDIFAIFSLSQ